MAKPKAEPKVKKPRLNIGLELGILMPGEAVETLVDELVDPGSHYTHGQRAKLSAALIAAGEKIAEQLQQELAGVIEHFDSETVFRWQRGSKSSRVNTDEVKKQYPEEDHPSLYYESVTDPRVRIELPFIKSRLELPAYVPGESRTVQPVPAPESEDGQESEAVAGVAGQQRQNQMDFPSFNPPEPF